MIQIRIVPEAKLVKLNFLCGNQDIYKTPNIGFQRFIGKT